MSGISWEILLRKFSVSLHVSLDIFCASVKSSMQPGTVKYSGRAIRAGFCCAALWIAALAAVRLLSRELRTFMWSRLVFKGVNLWGLCYRVLFLNI